MPGVTIIVGPNTFGKTNILEAIYLLASGKSFRAEVEKEIISYGEEIARIDGVTNLSSLEILITTGSVGGKKAPKKQFLVNGVKKRMTDFIGHFFAVLFSPQDLQLVTDSPSLRRKYLNSVLSCVDKEYRRALLVYEKALRQRNRILEMIREKRAKFAQLEYWDRLLIKNGSIITEKRGEFIDFINTQYRPLNREKSPISQLETRPFPQLTKKKGGVFKIVYEKNEISEERLKEKQEREIILGMTLVGPHRDDFIINLQSQNSCLPAGRANLKTTRPHRIRESVSGAASQISNLGKSRDLSIYGSRGEQRLAVLWLKLGELAFLEEETDQKPVLLLDDIFSELDSNHRDLVTKIIPNQQTIITTTEERVVKGNFLKEAQRLRLDVKDI